MGLNVLIVEDEAIVSEELKTRFQALGHRVVATASRGRDAIQIATDRVPDLVVMDFRLRGEINGVETAEIIRHRQSTVPVIFITASTEFRMPRNFGRSILLRKPFDGYELRRAIEKVIEDRPAAMHNEAAHAAI